MFALSNTQQCASILHSTYHHITKENALGTMMNIWFPSVPTSPEYSKNGGHVEKWKRKRSLRQNIRLAWSARSYLYDHNKLTVYLCSLWPGSLLHKYVDLYYPVSIPVSSVITPETFDQLQSRSCPGHAKSDKRAVRSTRIILNVTQPKSQELLHKSPRVIRFVFGWKSWCFLVISNEKV